MGLKEFEGRRSFHLRRNDTQKIILYTDNIDGGNLPVFNDEFEGSGKFLVLFALPVEIDASRRATRWLQEAGITSMQDHPMAVSALRSAAYTYVSAALGSLATLVYYVMIFLSNRD